MRKNQIINTLKKTLQKDRKILFSYLYGSFNRRKDARDIDVGVYLKNHINSWQKSEAVGTQLEKAIGYQYPIDIHCLNQASIPFRFQLLTKSQLLSDSDKEKRLNWEAHTMSRYQDLKPMLDFYDRKFLSQ